MLSFWLLVWLISLPKPSQSATDSTTLERGRFRKGEETLKAFKPVSDLTRNSIVKLNVDGETVALGTVVEAGGLVLTKASEIKPGKITCWLATERQVDAELLAKDETEDLALLRVKAPGLKPVQWAEEEVAIGQWAITPGITPTPHAVGIISALPRRIRPPRSFIGIQFGTESTPRIGEVMSGLGAEKAGLKKGDIILGVNGTTITNREQMVEMLREFREGQKIKVRVQRLEDEFEVEIAMMRPTAGSSGAAFAPEQRLGRMSGDTSQRAEGFEQAIEHDTVLQPWLCGGPLVDLDGHALGLNIARASRVTTFALPAKLVRRVLEELKTKPTTTRG